VLSLPPHLRSLAETDIPRFSDGEMKRRRALVESAMAEAGAEHLVFCGYNRAGSAVQWLTQWPVTAEAIGVLSPGQPDALFVQWINHEPLARRFADKAEVAWGGESSIRKAIETLERRGARADRIALIGAMPFEQHAALAAKFGKTISLNRVYQRLRAVKSAEELDWLRIGAAFSDAGMAALRNAIRPGVDERQLGDAVERAYVAEGGGTGIHYIGTTSMHDPDLAVPRQFPSSRAVRKGDVVVAEITAHFFDYGGQVLRSFAVGEEPTPLYRALHDAADAAFDAISGVLKEGATPAQVIEARA
jgi:Xaa-Pro aminopeptidase